MPSILEQINVRLLINTVLDRGSKGRRKEQGREMTVLSMMSEAR